MLDADLRIVGPRAASLKTFLARRTSTAFPRMRETRRLSPSRDPRSPEDFERLAAIVDVNFATGEGVQSGSILSRLVQVIGPWKSTSAASPEVCFTGGLSGG